MSNASNKRPVVLWLALLFVLAVVIVIVVKRGDSIRQSVREAGTNVASRTTNLPSLAISNAPTTPLVSATPSSVRPGFQLRPLAVATESATHQWTSDDARDTNIIQLLAHNDAEYARMVDENTRIHRRQLVYRKDTAAAVMQRARASGEQLKQLTLPGLDGQEIQFQIDRADLEPSQQTGTFTGQLPNRPNSMVTLAYKFGREAFTVLSPDDGIFLQGHPRESGEIILTSFDPTVYLAMPEGEPIKTK